MIFPANLVTGANYSAFSTNHLTDIDKTEQNYNQKQHKNLILSFKWHAFVVVLCV